MYRALLVIVSVSIGGCCSSHDVWSYSSEAKGIVVLADGQQGWMGGNSTSQLDESSSYAFGRPLDFSSNQYLYVELRHIGQWDEPGRKNFEKCEATALLDTTRPINALGNISISGGSMTVRCRDSADQTQVIAEASSTSGWTFTGYVTVTSLHPTDPTLNGGWEPVDEERARRATGWFSFQAQRGPTEIIELHEGSFEVLEWPDAVKQCWPVIDAGPG